VVDPVLLQEGGSTPRPHKTLFHGWNTLDYPHLSLDDSMGRLHTTHTAVLLSMEAPVTRFPKFSVETLELV